MRNTLLAAAAALACLTGPALATEYRLTQYWTPGCESPAGFDAMRASPHPVLHSQRATNDHLARWGCRAVLAAEWVAGQGMTGQPFRRVRAEGPYVWMASSTTGQRPLVFLPGAFTDPQGRRPAADARPAATPVAATPPQGPRVAGLDWSRPLYARGHILGCDTAAEHARVMADLELQGPRGRTDIFRRCQLVAEGGRVTRTADPPVGDLVRIDGTALSGRRGPYWVAAAELRN